MSLLKHNGFYLIKLPGITGKGGLTRGLRSKSYEATTPGLRAVAGSNPVFKPKAQITATMNGTQAEVVFAELTPQFIRLTQVNFRVPGLPAGTYPPVGSVNGQLSNTAMVIVKYAKTGKPGEKPQ